MAAVSKNWVVIADGAVDPASPLDTVLMTGIRDSLVNLDERLGGSTYTRDTKDHDHDGVNSRGIAGEIGTIKPWPGLILPGVVWDWCDGGTLLRATSSTLFGLVMKEANVALTIASPCVVAWNAHGLRTNMPIRFFTTGALPTGITAGTHGGPAVGTEYFVKVIDANTFNIAATPGGANINTSGTQSGTHTGTVAPHGDGDGSTTFHKPDYRGRVPAGRDDMGGTAANRITSGGSGILGNVPGRSGGAETVTISVAQVPSITPSLNNATTVLVSAGGTGGAPTSVCSVNGIATITANAFGSGAAVNNAQPTGITDWIIRIS